MAARHKAQIMQRQLIRLSFLICVRFFYAAKKMIAVKIRLETPLRMLKK
jgi:hypothetical protein